MAGQQARANISSYRAQQVQQLTSLGSGYAKKNTIPPSTEYGAYMNIPFDKKVETLFIQITIEGQNFLFEWNNEQLIDL